MWIQISTMHFTGPAARWWQSIGARLCFCTWSEFSRVLLERFGKDQHEYLIRQLFRIRQSTSIAAYIEQFTRLVDQLLAYESQTDPLFYTMRFTDGLKDHKKSAVLIQRPPNLDTACALAQLQEVSEPSRSTPAIRNLHSPLPLPRPPQADSSAADQPKLTNVPRPRQANDKLASLKAYRRARGLCDKCAEKWAPGHRCAPTVQLHVLEEVWELMEEPSETPSDDAEYTASGELLSLSLSDVSGNPSCHTLQLSGQCQGQLVVMLIDSGSSHSFVSSTLAAKMTGATLLPQPVTVHT
jgi:hypothetical protein